jgi:hypothetical protein
MTNYTAFPYPLVYTDVSLSAHKFKIILTQPFMYCDNVNGYVTAPKDFDSDLASIPESVQSLVPKVGTYDAAALIHDWLYATMLFSKTECDNIFLRAMKDAGVSYFKRYTIYWAVRLFAGDAWEDCRETRDHYRGMMK